MFKKREVVKQNIVTTILEETGDALRVEEDYFYTPVIPQLQIGSDERLYYISDIHLEHKLIKKYGKSLTDSKVTKYIESLVKELLIDIPVMERGLSYLLIGGDVAHSVALSKIFYETVVNYWKQDHVIAILGNHELWDVREGMFSQRSLKEVVAEYRELFDSLGITFLHNDLLISQSEKQEVISEKELLAMTSEELKRLSLRASLVLLGGTGFSGLNEQFNANSGLYRERVTVEMDKKESEKFCYLYNQLQASLHKNQHVVIFSHMPKEDWSNENYQSDWSYVNGHTHINRLILDDEKTVYADNQIGYFNQQIGLKSFDINKAYDLFQEYPNGIYSISKKQYVDFYRGKRISMTFNRKNGHILMLKRAGMYCFIFLNLKNDRLYLLNGGMPNKLKNQDLFYYYDSLAVYSDLIKKTFKNYNQYLKDISSEVKKLGGTGKVHGNIIDIDFYNHLAIDPFNGGITPYFALSMTDRDEYSNMDDFFLSLDSQVKLNYKRAKKETAMTFLTIEKEYALINQDTIKKVTSTEMYGPSNMMKKIQYLTENNIIRVWNEEVFEHPTKIN